MKLLDLFCGAGGAAMGYSRAGFDQITGVDLKPMPRYPFDFVQADALEYLAGLIKSGEIAQYDAIHASPPCQKYGKTKHLAGSHPQLIEQVRDLLMLSGLPYVIENVPGAPLIDAVLLTGAMFGQRIKRDRLFECSFQVPFVMSPSVPSAVKMGRAVAEGDIIQPVGHFSNVQYARQEMGIDWMIGAELSQAIPPAYTEWIGKKMIEANSTICR